MTAIEVASVPRWVPLDRLLGEYAWETVDFPDGTVNARADVEPPEAATIAARLRGVGLGGRPISVETLPALPRALVRAARTLDARARRTTTPGFLRPGTRCDAKGRVSLTPEVLARSIGERAAGRSVTDLGCGVGGNAIGFALARCAVTAVERDHTRLELARHNARIYGVSERIRFVQGDATEAATRFPADLWFVDPPWGADWNRTRTTLEDFPLLRAILLAPVRCGSLWAKLPPSFDPTTIRNASPEAWFGQESGDRHRVKFVLVRVDF